MANLEELRSLVETLSAQSESTVKTLVVLKTKHHQLFERLQAVKEQGQETDQPPSPALTFDFLSSVPAMCQAKASSLSVDSLMQQQMDMLKMVEDEISAGNSHLKGLHYLRQVAAQLQPESSSKSSKSVDTIRPPRGKHLKEQVAGLSGNMEKSNTPGSRIVTMMKDAYELNTDLDMSKHGNCFYSIRKFCFKVVKHGAFEFAVGFIIILNSILIGVQAELSLRNEVYPLDDTVELAFLGFFWLEITFRLLACGCSVFRDPWFIFDFLLVGVTTFAFALENMETGFMSEHVSMDVDESLVESAVTQLLILRMFRMLRFVRALRIFRQFRPIWKLVYGLISSAGVVASAMMLIFLALYVFACVGVELITKNADLRSEPVTREIIDLYFDSLGMSMLTLTQFVTQDSIASIYVPLIRQKPWLVLYFLPILLIISISLMNLVTAVLVDGASERSGNDAEFEKELNRAKIQKTVPALLKLFQTLDKNQNGVVTLDEVAQMNLDELPDGLADMISVDNMVDLFEMLDVDGSGELSPEEFVAGILNVTILDMPIAGIQSLKLARQTRAKVDSLLSEMQSVKDSLRAMNKPSGLFDSIMQ